MRKATVLDLHMHTGAIVDEAAEGQIITIVKRGVPVAELRPLKTKRRPRGLPKNWEKIMSKSPQVPGDSGKVLEEDRS
jgi:prevent-host-death family protein